jgi:hypothetical protein
MLLLSYYQGNKMKAECWVWWNLSVTPDIQEDLSSRPVQGKAKETLSPKEAGHAST